MRVRHKPDLTTDQLIWTQYVADVRPLKGRTTKLLVGADPIPPATEPVVTEAAPARSLVGGSQVLLPPVVIGRPPAGLDRVTWQRFRGNKIPPAKVLDLHGMTVAHAHSVVSALIQNAAARGDRCVEIITGYGRGGGDSEGGVLRREVPLWLSMAPLQDLILALVHPHSANPGAIRVLIRRRRARPTVR